MRIGFGRDIHRFVASGRPFILGGVHIPCDLCIDAHSDGDVLLHAVAEAILGALALGDLGTHFNENDPKCENMDSKDIVFKVLDMMKQREYRIENIDISIIVERPKLRPYIEEIRKSLKDILNIDLDAISVKAQTNEKIDDVGENKAIDCYCAVLLSKC